MNKILEETLAKEKPDPVFEQRMLAGFRNRVPQRSGLVKLLVDLMHLRATQIAAVAAVLLGLIQIGRMITGEPVTAPPERERYVANQFAAQPLQVPASGAARSGALAKSADVAAGQPQDLALKEPPPPAPAQSKDQERRVLRWNERSWLDQISRLLRKKSRKLQCSSLLQHSPIAS